MWVDTPHPKYGSPIFPNLVHCEWSVTGEPSGNYNCIGFTIGNLKRSINPQEIDIVYGNRNGIFETADVDSFYLKELGLKPVANGPEDAIVMYYGYKNDWDYINNPAYPLIGYHGAIRKTCSCGKGKWLMYESKCGSSGETFRIEHRWNQLNNEAVFYGKPTRFYK